MLEITTFCLFMLPAIVVTNWFDSDGSKLKLRLLFIYIAVRGCLLCSNLVQPRGYCMLPLCRYGSCSRAIVGSFESANWFVSSVLAWVALCMFSW